jgi:hypothetical protein
MAVEAAFKRYSGTGHGVLQAFNGTHVARAGGSVVGLGAVALHERLEFAFASIQGAGEVQGNIGIVSGLGLAVFARPVIEQLPLVGAFFGNFDRIALHMCRTKC